MNRQFPRKSKNSINLDDSVLIHPRAKKDKNSDNRDDIRAEDKSQVFFQQEEEGEERVVSTSPLVNSKENKYEKLQGGGATRIPSPDESIEIEEDLDEKESTSRQQKGTNQTQSSSGWFSGLYNSWKGLYTPVAPSETELDDLSESKRQHGDPGVELEFQQQPVQPDEEEEAEEIQSSPQSSRPSCDIRRLPRWLYTRIPYFSLGSECIFQYYFVFAVARGIGSYLIDWRLATPTIDPSTGKDSLTDLQDQAGQAVIYAISVAATLLFNSGVDLFGINGPSERHQMEESWDSPNQKSYWQRITSFGAPLPPAVTLTYGNESSTQKRARLKAAKEHSKSNKHYLIADNKLIHLDPLGRLRIESLPRGIPNTLQGNLLANQVQARLAETSFLRQLWRWTVRVAAQMAFDVNNLVLGSSDGTAILDWSNETPASRIAAAIWAINITILARYYYKFFMERRIEPHLEFLGNCIEDTLKGTIRLAKGTCNGNFFKILCQYLRGIPAVVDISRVFLINDTYRTFIGLYTAVTLIDQIELYYHVEHKDMEQARGPAMLIGAISVFLGTLVNRLLPVVEKYTSGNIDDLTPREIANAKASLNLLRIIIKVVLPILSFAAGLGGFLFLKGAPITAGVLVAIFLPSGIFASYKSLVSTTALAIKKPPLASQFFTTTVVTGSMSLRAFCILNASLNSFQRFILHNFGVDFFTQDQLNIPGTSIPQRAVEKLCFVLMIGVPMFICEIPNFEQNILENSEDLRKKYRAERGECSEVPQLYSALHCRATLVGGGSRATVPVAAWNALTKATAEYDEGYARRHAFA